MTTATVDIGTLLDSASDIVCTPDIRGGRPRIAGTGVMVQRILVLDTRNVLAQPTWKSVGFEVLLLGKAEAVPRK